MKLEVGKERCLISAKNCWELCFQFGSLCVRIAEDARKLVTVKQFNGQVPSLRLANDINSGDRTLAESTLHRHLFDALQAFVNGTNPERYVLIGELAVSYHAKPRYTTDAELLFATETDLPVRVVGFTRVDERSFQHDESKVVIAMFSPASLELDGELLRKIFATSVKHAGLFIASPEGLIALKLLRQSYSDLASIAALLVRRTIDMSAWQLSITELATLARVQAAPPHAKPYEPNLPP